jgi:hypothetical protein
MKTLPYKLLDLFIYWPHACWANALPLVPLYQPFFALVIFLIGLYIFAYGWPWTLILLPMPQV